MITDPPDTQRRDPKNIKLDGRTRSPAKRPYRRPELVNYGDVRDVTFGSFGGFTESGGGGGFRP